MDDKKLDRESNNCEETKMEEEEAAGSPPQTGSSAAAAAGGGRILVKLKLPKTAEVAEIGRPAAEEVKSHYCKECDKSFSSGKALGGHMSSAHVQANKDHSFKKVKSKTNRGRRDGPGSSSGSTANVCNICRKDFPSEKSLYGHMRCHPEREWRGMEPPAPAGEEKIDSELESEDFGLDQEGGGGDGGSSGRRDAVALMSELDISLTWTTRARRGGRGQAINRQTSDDSLMDAVYQLVKLFNEKPEPETVEWASELKKRKREASSGPELDNVDRARESKKQKREHRSNYSGPKLQICEREASDGDGGDDDEAQLRRKNIENNDGKGKEKIDYEGESKGIRTQPEKRASTSPSTSLPNDDVDTDMNEKHVNQGAKCRSEAQELISPIKSSSSPEKYTCTTCNKSFPTHQALGGHRSSHNKFKLTVINTIDERANAKINNVATSDHDDNSHSRKIRNKGFRSWQALGGHKRRQIVAADDNDDNNNNSNSNALSFDLNKEPDVEEDNDNEDGANYEDPSKYKD